MKKQKRSQKKGTSKIVSVPMPPPSKRRVWLFRLVSLIFVPALFLGILESALRCAGYGYPPGAIIKCKLEDKDVYCPNPKFAWRFFPPSIARDFDGFVFDAAKTPQTYRIFILGSSAAAGIPAPAYNFGHILEVMLDRLYPDTRFEVLTVAMPAINSHAILEMAKDCARHQPDLFIVYMGNNEVVGPYGPGTVFSPLSASLPMIRANIALKSIRLGQLLDHMIQGLSGVSGKQHWGGLEMFLDKQVRYNDPSLEITYRHFEMNLRDICRAGLDAGAAVIVSNVPSNLKDCPPFSSVHKMELTDAEKQRWQEIYQEGVAFETKGQFAQAIEKYLDAEKIDAMFADLQFRLGRCYWNIGDYARAREKYIQSREYDALRFRADNRINEIIRAVAEHPNEDRLYFVDSAGAMEAGSPHQVPGSELFYEHVHMNFKGNYIVAASLLDCIRKILPPARQTADSSVFSEEEAARAIAYTDYERAVDLDIIYRTFLQRPPFTNQLYHTQFLAEIEQQINQQFHRLNKTALAGCLEQHQQAIQNRPDDWQIHFRYATFLNISPLNAKTQEEELRKVLKLCPYKSAYLNLGRILHRQSKNNEARTVLTNLLKSNPNMVEAHIELASIYRERKEYDKEIQHLLKAISLGPEGLIDSYLSLAEAYIEIGKPQEAMDILHTAAGRLPEENTAPVHAFLAYLLYDRNDLQNALKEIHHAIKVDPTIKTNPKYDSILKSLGIKPNQ